jgi:hypothetical protein
LEKKSRQKLVRKETLDAGGLKGLLRNWREGKAQAHGNGCGLKAAEIADRGEII